jgi:hypothetical protein
MGMTNLLNNNRDVVVFIDWQYGRNGHKNIDGLIAVL